MRTGGLHVRSARSRERIFRLTCVVVQARLEVLKQNIPSEILEEDTRDMTLAKGNYAALEKTGATPVLLTRAFCLAHHRL